MDIRSIGAGYNPKVYSVDKTDKSEKLKKTAPPEEAKTVGEKVELSAASNDAQTVLDAIRALPEVRIDMVEKIKERIKNNDYPLESRLHDTVEKMVNAKVLLPL
jgi:anti-sigma28 factor (negative regulator of flagellin synthesis)